MSAKFSSDIPRVPLPVSGINVNFCKNMDCSHFGAPASPLEQKRGAGNKSEDDYIVNPKKPFRKALLCKRCKQYSMLKSNQGVFEEAARFSEFLEEESTIVGCPAVDCVNFTVDVKVGTSSYFK